MAGRQKEGQEPWGKVSWCTILPSIASWTTDNDGEGPPYKKSAGRIVYFKRFSSKQ